MSAVFFDMDGTLFDTVGDLAAGVNATRVKLGFAEIPKEDVVAAVGNGARKLLERTIPEKADAIEEVLPLYLATYNEHALDTTMPYPGVVRTLGALADRGWKMGIVTNKPREATVAIIEHFGLRRYFRDAIVAGGDCVEMKPAALPIREAAARMGGHRLSSHDWMVGDNWTDLEAATNAGIKSAFCTYGIGRIDGRRFNERINRFDELLRFLKPED